MLIKPSKLIRGQLPITPNNIYFHFQEYLMTWLNVITKERCLYPEESFEERNSFNLRVPYNRHPKVIEWMNGLINDLMEDLVFKHTRSVVLVVFDEFGVVHEKYTLDLRQFLHVSKDYYDKEIKDLQMDWKSVNDEFRGNLYTLLEEIRKLPALDEDLSFKFQVFLETSNVSMSTKWVLDKSTSQEVPVINDYALDMDMEEVVMSTQDDKKDANGGAKEQDQREIPLQVVDIGPIVFFSSISVKQ